MDNPNAAPQPNPDHEAFKAARNFQEEAAHKVASDREYSTETGRREPTGDVTFSEAWGPNHARNDVATPQQPSAERTSVGYREGYMGENGDDYARTVQARTPDTAGVYTSHNEVRRPANKFSKIDVNNPIIKAEASVERPGYGKHEFKNGAKASELVTKLAAKKVMAASGAKQSHADRAA